LPNGRPVLSLSKHHSAGWQGDEGPGDDAARQPRRSTPGAFTAREANTRAGPGKRLWLGLPFGLSLRTKPALRPGTQVSQRQPRVDLAVRLPCHQTVHGPALRCRTPASPQRERPAKGGEEGRWTGRPQQARHLPHVPPLLRHPSARRRLRHPHRPGATRPQGCQDDHDLHPRPQPRRPGGAQPPGLSAPAPPTRRTTPPARSPSPPTTPTAPAPPWPPAPPATCPAPPASPRGRRPTSGCGAPPARSTPSP